MSDAIRNEAERIVARLRDAGHEAWFVGGCVRDIIRGVDPDDYDIVTSARPEAVHGLFPRTIPVGEAFGVVIVLAGDVPFEVATFRTEGGYEDGRRPSLVEFADAEADVKRRDFTVNGLLMDPHDGRVIDHVGGLPDIESRVIRTIGDPDERFAEDHLRLLRAVRFASTLEFTVDPATLAAVARNAASIARISAERVRDELTKILSRGGARGGFELLLQTGLLKEVLPEVAAMVGVSQPPQFHPEGDVWEHTMIMLEMMEPGSDYRLAWGILLHDVGKPPTREETSDGVHFYGHCQVGGDMAAQIMRRLKFSNAEIDSVKALVDTHMRFMPVQEMRPNRLKRFLRMPEFDLHLELHRIDCASSHGLLDNYEFCKAKLSELAEEDLRPPPLVTGNDLISMGFMPGALFGEILTAVEDAQLDGAIGTKEEAERLIVESWGDHRGS